MGFLIICGSITMIIGAILVGVISTLGYTFIPGVIENAIINVSMYHTFLNYSFMKGFWVTHIFSFHPIQSHHIHTIQVILRRITKCNTSTCTIPVLLPIVSVLDLIMPIFSYRNVHLWHYPSMHNT